MNLFTSFALAFTLFMRTKCHCTGRNEVTSGHKHYHNIIIIDFKSEE